METTLKIYHLENFKSKFAQLQRKAKSVNVAIPQIISIEEKSEKHRDCDGIGWDYVVTYHDITIEFDEIKLAGEYTVIARFDYDENLINIAPGQSLPTEFLHFNNQECELCHVNHDRKRTYFVYDGANYSQVGHNCLAKHLGINPAQCLAMSDFAVDLGELLANDDYDPTSSEQHETLAYILKVASFFTLRYGYTSRQTAMDQGKIATATAIQNFIHNLRYGQGNEKAEAQAIEDALVNDQQSSVLRDETIAYMKSLENSTSAYELNLFNIATNDYVTTKSFGYAVSAPMAVLKQQEKNKTQSQDKGFFGNEGHKFDKKNPLIAKLEKIAPYTSSFDGAACAFYTFVDSDGFKFTWSTGYKQDLTIDTTYSITSSALKHTVYTPHNGKSIKQNVLSRCKYTEV